MLTGRVCSRYKPILRLLIFGNNRSFTVSCKAGSHRVPASAPHIRVRQVTLLQEQWYQPYKSSSSSTLKAKFSMGAGGSKKSHKIEQPTSSTEKPEQSQPDSVAAEKKEGGVEQKPTESQPESATASEKQETAVEVEPKPEESQPESVAEVAADVQPPKSQEEPVSEEMEEDYVQAVVAKASEFGENEMREVDIGESKALVVHQNGEFSAIGHKCTHYGAPLVKGYLGSGRVRCPWHGACFNIKNGDIEEFPGLDNIPCFQVKLDGDNVVVKAKKTDLADFRHTPSMCPAATDEDSRTFLIVGGGPASVSCAETLRKEGFKGRIVLASRENDLPYDRPKLSKAMHLTAESITLRPQDFYQQHDIDLMLGKEVAGVDVSGKKVVFTNGGSQSYDTLMLATGSTPRTLPIPGFDLENVFLLRDPSQANKIAECAAGKKVVVIGTSFIGMEVTAYLSDKAASISCIDITAVPFERVLGDRVGKMLQSMQEENGIKFYLSAGVKEIVGENGKVTGVTIPSGETLEADVVVAGVGVVPATNYLKDSTLLMTPRGEVIVDQFMKAAERVYAAGDIVRFPLPMIGGDTNIGHWQIAHNHGRVAARNMLGKEEAFNSIPYFWTVQFGKSLRYCGHALSWDEIIYDGSPEERKFAAYYIKNDQVLAVSSLNFDPVVSKSAELMYQGRMPSGAQLRENPDLMSHL